MPKLSYDPNRYYRYDEMVQFLHQAVEAYPQLVRLESIGKSYEGRDLWLAVVTNTQTGPDSEKPAYWIDANIHAVELCGSAVALYTIWYLLENYKTDRLVTHLLDTRAFYILPRMSPDGTEYVLKTQKWVRSSVRLYPFHEIKDGLHPEDINGDGEILQMRVEDPLGEWKVSQKDPRLMLKRQPDDLDGPFYRLYTEGRFLNYDGFRKEVAPTPYGLDLNRNFPHEWQIESGQQGAGEYPTSESEVRAVVEFFYKHRNICGALTYHTTSGVILRPYSGKPDTAFPNFDLAVYKAIGERGTDATGYRCVSVNDEFRYDKNKPITGVFDDWAYDNYGVFAYTTELWSIAAHAGIEVKDFIQFFRERSEEDELKLLHWQDQELNGAGFQNWTPFEHPQLGRVEIGGWRLLYTWVNPPPKFLPEECHKNMLFSFRHAVASPRLRIREFRAQPVGADLYRVS
ncbi:MAG: M14 family metallopeptidase, partial [Candidatus Bipolaricaulota bacterium]|nr:M14 family metallopeptidase [Candidatus Bipolaricaulota bacterium]